MCQVFYCPREVPSRDLLWEANRANPHGIGFAWVENGRVNWSKGYDDRRFEEAAELFESKLFPKAIHFRLATHGGKDMDMTHPFTITRLSKPELSGRTASVLFHNGVWTDYDDHIIRGVMSGTIPKGALNHNMSDSRAMAVLAGNFGERILDLMNLDGEKVLILRGNGSSVRWGTWYDIESEGDYTRSGYIDAWWEKDLSLDDAGFYYSNRFLRKEEKERWKKQMKEKNSGKGNVVMMGNTTEVKTNRKPVEKGSYLDADREAVQAHIEGWEGHYAD
jgi:hypothetical protein